MGETKAIAGPFWTRRKARSYEAEIQDAIELHNKGSAAGMDFTATVNGEEIKIPGWAQGARVERIGSRLRASWTVVATSWAGR